VTSFPFPSRLSRFLLAAMLVASGRAECQQPDAQDPTKADAAQDSCRSIVMVHCAQAQQDATTNAPADPRRATQQKLDARRLRQMQTQAGLNAVEVTGQRPTEAQNDSWESFRQSVASAAEPPCFSPNAPPQQPFAAQGLLALPFTLTAAATGKCR
jgi:hypothetical protein